MMRSIAWNYAKTLKCILPGVRQMSSSGSLTTVEVNDKTGIATLTLNRPPVNGLNLELLTSIKNSIEEIENNKSKGLILTSSSKTIFSGGLDIMEMYKPDPERVKAFWTALQDAWITLYGCSVPSVALVNGHSPAGGCLLATSCEYRVMLPNYTIGLNETKLGIVAPEWFMSAFLNVLPRRTAEIALTQGKLFTTDEALQAGLIDEIAATKEEGIVKCEQFIASFAKCNPIARAMTKQKMRQSALDGLINSKEQDLQLFLFIITQPMVQKGLGLYLEGLKKKKA
ncbi:enoyl-CoA delta isomerase 1, mitochondrial [Eupeodes corollae]|uniref:enoyl-CoA delta isomerase 1, mitochondrial n=1 Tax=Eupeodes corollae TaxID=290404 RepID=UPI0024934D05|nr:enoyl-CoA delta isomerase 1, mitochondrial [Eupeodes corollae]